MCTFADAAALPLPPRGRDPTTNEQCTSGTLLPPQGTLLPAPYAETKQVGTPPNDGRDRRCPLKVLPDFGPRSRRDTLLHLETGQQDQPLDPPQHSVPACPSGVPPRVAEKLERSSTRQAREAVLRITLLLQDYRPDPDSLKGPREDHSSLPTCGSPTQRAVAPQPMRFAPWAQHLGRVPHPHQRRQNPAEAPSQGFLPVSGH